MKPSFLGHEDPLFVAMLQSDDLSDLPSEIKNALYKGANGFCLQLEKTKKEYRTEEKLKKVFAYMENKPCYVTNYRFDTRYNEGLQDEELIDDLMLSLKCGATLIDVMSDMYCPDPLQLTFDKKAVEKQKAFADKIHNAGGEVLMSCHTNKFLPPEEILKFAFAQKERGADIAKIVTLTDTEEEMLSHMQASLLLKKELGIPFLLLSGGKYCKLNRAIGPMIGSCMYLCRTEYKPGMFLLQPLLENTKRAYENIDWRPERL